MLLRRLRSHASACLASAALGLFILPAAAGDFQPKRVAADAQWLAFVNVEGMLNSTIGKFMMSEGNGLGFSIEGEDFDHVKEQFGIDPIKDIRSITLYGQGMLEDHSAFVALIETTSAIDDALANFKAAAAQQAEGMPPMASVQLAGQEVVAIGEGDETTYLQVRPGRNSDERLVIVTMSRDWMSKGLGVLEGKSDSIAGADKPGVRASVPDGVLMFASCGDMEWVKDLADAHPDHEPASAILQGAKGLDIAFGEAEGQTFFTLNLETASKDDAQNLSDIGRGLIGMARLAGGNEPEIKPLLEPLRSLKINVEAASVSLSLKHDSAKLVEIIQALAEHHGGHDDDDDDDDDDGATKIEIKASVGSKNVDNDDDDDN